MDVNELWNTLTGLPPRAKVRVAEGDDLIDVTEVAEVNGSVLIRLAMRPKPAEVLPSTTEWIAAARSHSVDL